MTMPFPHIEPDNAVSEEVSSARYEQVTSRNGNAFRMR